MNLVTMHILHRPLGALLAATSSKPSSGGSSTLFIFILLFAAMYFLWLRPQRKKLQRKQLDQVRSIDVGDEVVTQSGIIGTVVALDDDRAEIQVSSGVVLTVVRAAVGRRVEPVIIEPPVDVPIASEVSDEEYDDLPSEASSPQKGRLWKRFARGEDA